MKKNILLILLLVSNVCFSQQKQFNISWETTRVLATETSQFELPGFNNENYSFDSDTGLKFVAQWESSRFVNETTGVLKCCL